MLITIIGNALNFYTIDNFKYTAFVLGIKDNWISFFYVLSGGFNIYAKFVVADLWDRFGFKSFYLNPFLRLLNLGMIIFICPFWNKLFLFEILIARFNLSFELTMDDFICFNHYDTIIALSL